MKLLFDGDWLAFSQAISLQNSWYEAERDGVVKIFKNITEFQNKTQSPEEWDLQYQVELVPNALSIAKKAIDTRIASVVEHLECDDIAVYLGVGESFRVDLSKMQRYKGKRVGGEKPLLLQAMRTHLLTKWDAKLVGGGLEADDQLVIDAVGTDNIIVGEDKDFRGCPVNYFDARYYELINGNQFGYLTRLKSSIKGAGRKFFYYQVLAGDTVDCYKLNCLSKIRYGDVSAYKDLMKCETDRECWQLLVNCAKRFYPEPLELVSWNGEPFTLTWLSALQEQVDMAYMRQHPTDRLIVTEQLDKYGVGYG